MSYQGLLNVRVIGNGGCLNQGLPYNSFMINGHFLVECPPDIMPSLLRLGVCLESIDSVYISHMHGDHTFGLPFLIINQWINKPEGLGKGRLTIMGPAGIGEKTRSLTEAAFSTAHPCYAWLEQNCRFEEIGLDAGFSLDGLSGSCFGLEHPLETYGFLLSNGAEPALAYIADTKWCPQVEGVLAARPKAVFMDMNGGDPDFHPCLEEVVAKGLPLVGPETTIYGIHLGAEFESGEPGIICGRLGMEVTV